MTQKPLESHGNGDKTEQGAGCLQHSDPSNHSDPVKEDRAMADEANIRACGDSATPFDEEILSQYLPLSSLICPDDNEEGRALYTLTSLLDRGVKPGVVLTLARFARGTDVFNLIANELRAAILYPAQAERFAANAMEHGKDAHEQDAIFDAVMFAAAQEVLPSDEWQSLHSVTKRIMRKMEGGTK